MLRICGNYYHNIKMASISKYRYKRNIEKKKKTETKERNEKRQEPINKWITNKVQLETNEIKKNPVMKFYEQQDFSKPTGL